MPHIPHVLSSCSWGPEASYGHFVQHVQACIFGVTLSALAGSRASVLPAGTAVCPLRFSLVKDDTLVWAAWISAPGEVAVCCEQVGMRHADRSHPPCDCQAVLQLHSESAVVQLVLLR